MRLLALLAAAGGLLSAEEARALDLAQQPFEVTTWRLPGTVYAIAHGPDGFLWAGTQSGLRRFDGASFVEPEQHAGSRLGDDHARRLLAARDGSVWIATGAGFLMRTADARVPYVQNRSGDPALVRYARGRFTRFTIRDGLASDWVWALAEDPSGAIWVGTEGGLSRFENGAFARFGTAEGLPAAWVTALSADENGTLWVGTTGGLAVRRAGRFERTGIDQPVLALARMGAGRLAVVTATGLVLHAAGETREIKTGRRLFALQGDREGHLWVGTSVGLLRLDEGAGPELVPSAFDGWAHALAEDRDGGLWAGTRDGILMRMAPPRVRSIGAAEGLPGPVAFAVLAASDGSLWMTTTEAVGRWADGRLTTYRFKTDLPARDARALAEGKDGSIWIGTSRDGLLRFHGGRFTQHRRPEGLRSDEIRSLLVDRAGDLWVTWAEGGVTRYRGGEPRGEPSSFGNVEGLCRGPLIALAEGRGGRIWFGGEKVEGLGLVEGTGARCLTAREGLPSPEVSAAHEDPQGTLWLGLFAGGGLLRFRDGRFTAVPRSAGFPVGTPFGFTEDGAGNLWTSSAFGVFRTTLSDIEGALEGRVDRIRSAVYTAADGMRSHECSNWLGRGVALDRGGRAWAATLAGVALLPPPERDPPPRADAVIDRVVVDGSPRGAEGPLVLRPGGADLELHFAAPSFTHPGRLRFRYRLEGLDGDWIDAGTHRQVRYARLGPGDYRFQVAALDWLERPAGRVAGLAVRVPRRFHQTGWFVVGCALLGAGAVAAAFRLRVRRIEARHAEVHAERARIARDLHDSLGQAFASIGLHLDGLKLTLGDAPQRVHEILERTRRIVDLCHEETRQSIWNIRGDGASSPSLKALLERIVSGFPERAAIAVSVTGSAAPVPRLVEHELGNIVREALANAVRHAQASRIAVEGRFDEAGLALVVRDDGRGIDEAARASGKGIGLLSMRERAARLGGVLTVGNGEGRGTEVSLQVPRSELDRLSRE